MKTVSVLFAFLLLLIMQDIAHACSCLGAPTVCQAYAGADAVFIGSVGSVQSLTEKGEGGVEYSGGQIAHVQVEKVFKGTEITEAVFRSFGTSCDARYREGQRWLFYADYDKNSKTWSIGGCGRSRGVENAANDLLYLQGLPASALKTRLAGTLEDSDDNRLIGIKVKISGEQKSYEVYTDRNGVYEIYGLPPGRYSVEPEVPFGLKVAFTISSESTNYSERSAIKVNLRERSCAGVDYYFMSSSSISGTVFGADGRPLPNVCLKIQRQDGKPFKELLDFDCTDKEGRFKLDEIPPGEYLIIANADGQISSEEPFQTLYYPGVFEKQKATVLTISKGARLVDYDIHVPSQEATRVIEGLLLYSDGRPAAGALVEFRADEVKKGYDGKNHTSTDAQGRFSLTVLQGLKGRLRGFMYTFSGEYANCPQLEKLIKASGNIIARIETEPIITEVDSDIQGVKLVFPFPGCAKARTD